MELSALIVDDEQKARELLAIMIRQISPETTVVMCSSVDETIREIKNSKPDLILLDVDMPGRSGMSLFESTEIEFDFEAFFKSVQEIKEYMKRRYSESN